MSRYIEGKNLIKLGWKNTSKARGGYSDDIWINEEFSIIHGEYGNTFYVEILVDGQFLSTYDTNRESYSYDLDELDIVIDKINIILSERISIKRDKILTELGI